jgi:hypothetical protein
MIENKDLDVAQPPKHQTWLPFVQTEKYISWLFEDETHNSRTIK